MALYHSKGFKKGLAGRRSSVVLTEIKLTLRSVRAFMVSTDEISISDNPKRYRSMILKIK